MIVVSDISSHPQLPDFLSRVESAVARTGGKPVLFGAVLNNDKELVRTLVVSGAFLDIEDPKYGTPMSVACRGRDESMIGLLVELGAKPSMSDVLSAAESGSFAVFDAVSAIKASELSADGRQWFDAGGPDWGGELVVRCISSGSVDIFEMAVHRFSLDVAQFTGRTSYGGIPLVSVLEKDKAGILSSMISLGLDCDHRFGDASQNGFSGYSLISYAAHWGSKRCLRSLIDANASLTSYSNGMTPLQWAVFAASDPAGNTTTEVAVECTKMLLDAGADPSEKTQVGRTLLQLSSKSDEMKTFLRSWIASRDISSELGAVSSGSKPSSNLSPF